MNMPNKKEEFRPRIEVGSDLYTLVKHFQDHGSIPDKFLVATDQKAGKALIDLSHIKKKYKASQEKINQLEEALDTFSELRNVKSSSASITAKRSEGKSESVAIALLSDVHFEEDVDPAKILNKNEYNPEIAEERLEKFFKNLLFIADIQRNGSKINTLVLAILGDLISGYIHPELVEGNHLSPIHASMRVQACIKKGIDFLLEHGKFKEIIIPCCVGNHGRTTPKKNISTSTDNSFESIIYIMLAEMFKDEPRVKFHISKGSHFILTIFDNYKIRFHHGDDIRYGGGVGGITIPVNKAIAGWNTVETVNLDCFGHFHQLFDGGNFISNGSVIGYGEYAFSIKAKLEPPKQAFFMIEKDKGKTIVAPILMD